MALGTSFLSFYKKNPLQLYYMYSLGWEKLRSRLSYAFKVSDGSGEVTEEERALIRKLAGFIVRKKLTSMAILLLETSGPLNFVGSSLMTFLKPTLGLLFSRREYESLERLLEKRCSLPLIVAEIEKAENEKGIRNHK